MIRTGIAVIVCCLTCAGCGELRTEYGRSTGTAGNESIAGFGVLREFYRQQGWTDRTVARLSERQDQLDAIVWTPSAEIPPTIEATEWFDYWLSQGDKTLVYVVRDHETADAYWRAASPLAPPDQRLEYRRRQAWARMEKLQALMQRPTSISNGWFTAVPIDPPEQVRATTGPWSDAVGTFDRPQSVDYRLRAYDPATDTVTNVNPGVAFLAGAFGFTEIETEWDVLLAGEQGTPLVGRATAYEWGNSQILVVAGGSLLNNFGLLDDGSRRLASHLEIASRPSSAAPGRVGFLYSDETGVSVSSLDPANVGPNGMEMLTTWPLNVLTIHGTVLALVICLSLFPIFGRPRRLRTRSSTDFADHVHAVAALMARTRATQYARVRISEYMVRVRGDHDSPWVIPEPPKPPPVWTPPPPPAPVAHDPVAHDPVAPDPVAPDPVAPGPVAPGPVPPDPANPAPR